MPNQPQLKQLTLEQLADKANFANSQEYHTSMAQLITSKRPYFYQFRKNGGMDILLIDSSSNIESAKLFRYNKQTTYKGMNLENDTPYRTGNVIIRILKSYIQRIEKENLPEAFKNHEMMWVRF